MHIHENMPLQSPNGMQSENERLEKRSFESVCIQTMTTTDDHGFNDISTMKMVTTLAITKTVKTIAFYRIGILPMTRLTVAMSTKTMVPTTMLTIS